MKRFLAFLLLFSASLAMGGAAPTSQTYSSLHVDQFRNGTPGMMIFKGMDDNNAYMLQGDPATGALLVSGTFSVDILAQGATGDPVPAYALLMGGTDSGTMRAMKVGADGAVQVGDNGSSLTVDGTVAATQSGSWTVAATESGAWNVGQTGTWTVQPGNTANTTPWLQTISQGGNTATVSGGGALKVDASASTQPISGTVAATQSGTWNIATVTAVTGITNALPAGSNIIGNVRIDQTTPGTTNGIVVNTQAPQTTTTAAFQAEGAVAFGSLTASYVTLFTPTAATKVIQMRNNTNAAVSVSMDAGSTTNYTLDAGDAVSLDLLANALNMGATAIQVKYAVGAPTSGSFRINGVH